MADAVQTQVIEGLNRAAAEPGGPPLFAGKGSAGLFANSAAGRQAAQFCKDQGLLRVVRTETRGKSPVEFCTITDKGMSFLLDSTNPRGVLEAMLRALDARRADQAELLDRARRTQAILEEMQASVARVLVHVAKTCEDEAPAEPQTFGKLGVPARQEPRPPETSTASDDLCPAPLAAIRAAIMEHLERWRDSGSLDDCPLPELFHRLDKSVRGLSIGSFHDALRELHDQERVFLHPWTGPLYELPEPALALLAGHEIAYYASLRCCGASSQPARPEIASVGA